MKYLYEFIGTFFLVFTVGMTVLEPNGIGPFAPLAIGSVLAVMVFAGGYLSGGHYNPAVSLAAFFRGKLSAQDLGLYWIFQLTAGAFAALSTLYLKGEPSPVPLEIDPLKALFAEFLFTFALCYVVLNTATVKVTSPNSYFGFAIGFTVLVGAYSVGAISGGAFNPAVAFGITLLNLAKWTNLWVYLVASAFAAFLAAFIVNKASSEKA